MVALPWITQHICFALLQPSNGMSFFAGLSQWFGYNFMSSNNQSDVEVGGSGRFALLDWPLKDSGYRRVVGEGEFAEGEKTT